VVDLITLSTSGILYSSRWWYLIF